MSNTSKLDREIWEEFYGQWELLAAHSLPFDFSGPAVSDGQETPLLSSRDAGPTVVLRESKQRRGQDFFRSAVLAAYNETCCITGISNAALLRAGHIVPWSQDESLRLDPRNGLCMNVLHDAAFDRGLITLGVNFELVVSDRLRVSVPDTVYAEMFATRVGHPITLPERFEPSTDSLQFHRTMIFQS